MKRRWLIIGGLVVAIPLLYLAWWLGSPLFIEDEVDEDIPENIVIVTDIPDTPTPEVADTGDSGQNPDISAEDMQATMDSAAAMDETVAETMPDEMKDSEGQITAVEVKRGQFRDADGFHKGSGDAIIFELSDGRHLVRFENFNVTNGPDLHVYLVPNANASGSVTIEGYLDLGMLKGNVGDQNYFIEAGVVIPAEASIVIWCEPFRVLFSVASLN